jgi:ribosomal protein L16/L10AE
MPLYEFRNTETEEQWTNLMSYGDMKQFLADNPHINPVFSINVIGGTGDRVKVESGMGDMLGRIARANPGSPLAEKYGDKGIKASKTREAVKAAQKRHNINTTTM